MKEVSVSLSIDNNGSNMTLFQYASFISFKKYLCQPGGGAGNVCGDRLRNA